MEILLDVTTSPEGRLAGSLRPADSPTRTPFSGTMELLALIEALCGDDTPGDHGEAGGAGARRG